MSCRADASVNTNDERRWRALKIQRSSNCTSEAASCWRLLRTTHTMSKRAASTATIPATSKPMASASLDDDRDMSPAAVVVVVGAEEEMGATADAVECDGSLGCGGAPTGTGVGNPDTPAGRGVNDAGAGEGAFGVGDWGLGVGCQGVGVGVIGLGAGFGVGGDVGGLGVGCGVGFGVGQYAVRSNGCVDRTYTTPFDMAMFSSSPIESTHIVTTKEEIGAITRPQKPSGAIGVGPQFLRESNTGCHGQVLHGVTTNERQMERQNNHTPHCRHCATAVHRSSSVRLD